MPADPAWDRCDWLDDLRKVPEDATWPAFMTGPHPRATGSFGAEFVAWAEARSGRRLRWWQRLVATRLLEHDGDGALVWSTVLWSTARQVGKSWLLRELILWRLGQADRFGEEQLVMHTGKDLPVCREVQRPARVWARRQGFKVREVNGQEEIELGDGSRWMIRGRDSVYGYSASVGAVDEAWHVVPAIVEDGLEPTMPEREQPQLWLISTAHRRATSLFVDRRSDALSQLADPDDTLLIEWSAPADVPLEDRAGWRAASPHWSARREKLVASKLRRALSGHSDDPAEHDPVASFRSQWLNQWPKAPKPVTPSERLVEPAAWSELAVPGLVVPSVLTFAVEDWFGKGAASAAAGLLGDGRVVVFGTVHERRDQAYAWVAERSNPAGSRLIVGASLDGDPAADEVPVASVGTSGSPQTKVGLPLLRELVAAGRLVHDGDRELSEQVGQARVKGAAGGLTLVPGSRSDLLRAAVWAVLAVLRPEPAEAPVPRPVAY